MKNLGTDNDRAFFYLTIVLFQVSIAWNTVNLLTGSFELFFGPRVYICYL